MTAKEEKVKELTLVSGEPGFWNNQEEAKKILEELSNIKKELDTIFVIELKLLDYEAKSASPEQIESLEKELKEIELKTFLNDPLDKGNAIMNFTTGVGGLDAQEWAGMLLNMYRRYCETKGWKVELLEESYGQEGGLKEATLEIRGMYSYGLLKKESGVHRLVRISPFSAKHLRHTSFALVDVLPETLKEEVEITLDPKDLRFDLFRSSGPGGQNVNKRETAARVTHLPTGVSAGSQNQRSQLQNKEKALELLKIKLHALLLFQQKKHISLLGAKNKPEWGNQARSYVLDPYQLVKDHKTNVETHDVAAVLNGDLEKFIEAQVAPT